MNKQRSQSRQEYQLQPIGRPNHGISPFQRSEQQRAVALGPPQQNAVIHVNPYHQQAPTQSATKVLPSNKRNELLKSKENMPLSGPYGLGNPLTPKGNHQQQQERQLCKSPIPLKPQTASCENSQGTIQVRRQSQLQGPLVRDRALAEISSNLFNSAAIPSAIARNQELMKNKWVHTTPESEPTKFNMQPVVSASFNLDLPQNDEFRLKPTHRRQNSDGKGSLTQPPANENRFKQLDELAAKIKNVEKAVEKYNTNKELTQFKQEQQCNLFTKQLQSLASLKKSESRNSIDSDNFSKRTLETECSMNGSIIADSICKPKTAELFAVPQFSDTSTRKIGMQSGRASHDIVAAVVKQPPNFVMAPPPASLISSPKILRDKSVELPCHTNFNFLKKKNSNRDDSTATKPIACKPTAPQAIMSTNTNTSTPVKQHPQHTQPTPSNFMTMSSPKQPNPFVDRPPIKLEDFEMGKQLGKGKFGQVFLVKHKLTGFLCAMKVIGKQSIREDKLETQMARELKIISFVKHPNLITCYGFFDDADNVYVLMELCSGGHLFKQIQNKRRLPQPQAAYIVRQVCQGVKYLHSLQILHRDIKPENIILENGIAKICDFGWSVFSGGLRKTVCGTPLYLSPEVVKGEDYDEKIDLWAVGILTYELLIGRIPFKIWSEAQLNRIVSDEVTFPDYIEVSQNAKDFITKILQKQPSKRCCLDDLLGHPFLSKVDLINSNMLLQ